jgi:cell division protein FtsW (lipid II flippase)
MKSFNLALAFVAVVTCLLAGAVLQDFVLVVFSLLIALGVFLLNKKLERRTLAQQYQKPRRPALHDEIHASDFLINLSNNVYALWIVVGFRIL